MCSHQSSTQQPTQSTSSIKPPTQSTKDNKTDDWTEDPKMNEIQTKNEKFTEILTRERKYNALKKLEVTSPKNTVTTSTTQKPPATSPEPTVCYVMGEFLRHLERPSSGGPCPETILSTSPLSTFANRFEHFHFFSALFWIIHASVLHLGNVKERAEGIINFFFCGVHSNQHSHRVLHVIVKQLEGNRLLPTDAARHAETPFPSSCHLHWLSNMYKISENFISLCFQKR